MTLRMKRTLFGMAALGLTALIASAEAPPAVMPPVESLTIQTPKIDPKDPLKVDPKKDDKKKDEPKKAPPVVPDVPPVTLPATTAPIPNVPLASSGTAIQVSSLPPVYGDFQFGGMYTPYLVATTPQGTSQVVKPGQVATFPLGTTFNDPNVQTQIVKVQTGTKTITIPSNNATDGIGTTVTIPLYQNRVQVVGPAAEAHVGGLPVDVVRGAFIISENESPRPIDRVYLSYNYYSNVNSALSVPELPVTNVARWTFGLEKTFLDGNASIGLRLPLLQVYGASNIETQALGDLSVVLKYAFINDYIANGDGSVSPGNVLSAGMVITAPTAGAVAYTADEPLIHSTVLQPWVGGILVRGKAFAQGFSSIAVPTDTRDTTYLFNSLQLGYLLYEAPLGSSRLLTSFTPVVEAHVTTPLNNRGITNYPVGSFDVVSITSGATFGLGKRSWLNLGVNAPVTGPVPYRVEAIAQLNFSY